MASIEKRTTDTGTSYRVKVRLRGHPVQSATFERLTDAKRWATHTEAAIREGRHFHQTEAKRRTLNDAIDRYEREYLPRLRTAADVSRELRWWRDELGTHALANLRPAVINEAMQALATGPIIDTWRNGVKTVRTNADGTQTQRGASTLTSYRQALAGVIRLCVREWQWLEIDPMMRVGKPKLPRGRVRFLSDEERERLLAACKPYPDLYDPVIMALSTGARHTEIMSARWPQVDLQRRVLILEDTKNGERRSLPLAEPAAEVLRRRSKVRQLSSDLIFPSHRNPSKPYDLRAPWRKAIAEAGIEDFRWHDLRHTAASYLAMSGASLGEIAEILGHKTLQMVKRYAHLSTEHVQTVADRMAERFLA